ncbi:MGMT family protein [Burkholderia thailandensis]|uniref:MGMT family protein n=1 Tax=Burkholderia thailandensis TaxID=57975 RepID=UPI00148EE82B|nr:hypothetical protein [Burkholderia thailandensis]
MSFASACFATHECRSRSGVSRRSGAPARRALAAANGANHISIVVPRHRIVGKDGALTGQGGGIEHKRRRPGHERRHAPAPIEAAGASLSRRFARPARGMRPPRSCAAPGSRPRRGARSRASQGRSPWRRRETFVRRCGIAQTRRTPHTAENRRPPRNRPRAIPAPDAPLQPARRATARRCRP